MAMLVWLLVRGVGLGATCGSSPVVAPCTSSWPCLACSSLVYKLMFKFLSEPTGAAESMNCSPLCVPISVYPRRSAVVHSASSCCHVSMCSCWCHGNQGGKYMGRCALGRRAKLQRLVRASLLNGTGRGSISGPRWQRLVRI